MPANNNSAVRKPPVKKMAEQPPQAVATEPRADAPKTAPPKPAGPAPAQRASSKPTAKQEENLLDFVIAPFTAWFDFIRKNWKQYYLGLLKIAFFNLAVTVVLLIIMGAILGAMAVIGFGANALANGAALAAVGANAVLLVAAVAIVCVMAILLIWTESTISLSSIVYTDSTFNGRKFSIRETAWAIKWKVLRYLVVSMAIGLVFAIPVLVVVGIYILGAGAAGIAGAGVGLAAAGGVLAGVLVMLYIVGAAIIYGLITQFWRYGLLVDGLGVRDSLGKSFAIVKANIVKVLAFDILLVIGAVVFSIPLMAYRLVEQIIEAIINVAVSLTGNDIVVLVVMLAVLAVNAVLQTLFTTLVQAFSLPTHYLFWKKVK